MTKSISGTPLDHEYRTADQDEHDLKNRRSALITLLEHAQRQRLSAVVTVDLVDGLGLEAELDELIAGDPERHRRLDEARQAAIELQKEAAAARLE